ncbi:MAG: adenylate/guanylate cyclase domain-containing protein [Deltaproteobacteria bacterium]|nr:adenylate/guanylate cyclase domain-containing protein [Deltaproteobacteria bacterium]
MSADRSPTSVLPPPREEERGAPPPPSKKEVAVALATALNKTGRRLVQRHLDARETFEHRLVRDILLAERFRARLLVAIPTIALFLLVVEGNSDPEAVAAVLHGRFDRTPVGFFLMAVAGFELYVLVWIGRLLARDGRPSMLRRYVHAFVETSLPTAVILYYASIDGPTQALLMPVAFVYSIFILLSTLGLDFLLCAFTGLVASVEYASVALLWARDDTQRLPAALSSVPHHLGKAIILFVGGIAAGFVATRLRGSFTRAIESIEDRARILGVFGQHVSPEVVERLVEGRAEVKSEQREVCVMFLDIRNFTAFSEARSASEVVDYLNVVFDVTIDAVVRQHGIVNKFLGDGFMAVFGAPIAEGNASRAAIDAAIDILARLEALSATGKIPPTRVGIGLHTGNAVVGNIGSRQRKEYTVIGDVVNVASRIESLNKPMGAQILVSDATWSRAGVEGVPATPHDDVEIRGRAQKMRIWQLG